MGKEDIDKRSLKTFLLESIFSAKEASGAIMEIYNSDFTVYHKDDNSSVSLSDKRSHEVIVRHLTTQLFNPHIYPILSEEGRAFLMRKEKAGSISGLLTLLMEQKSL